MLLSRTLLKRHSVLPGFDLALGFALLYISLIVLMPLSAAFLKTFTLSWPAFWDAVTSPRVVASYRLTFGASLAAALLNAVFGLIVAWVLVRYDFPFKRLVDALVDLPFALAHGGGRHRADRHLCRERLDRPVAALQGELHAAGRVRRAGLHRPALRRAHGAAGARGREPRAGRSRGHARREPLADLHQGDPADRAARAADRLCAGLRARAGRIRLVIFIAGNMPMVSEITPLLIITKLEQYDYAGATAIAVVMLLISFALLLLINSLQTWARKRQGGV